MLKTRIIPCLLLKELGLVKTINFNNPKYIGDPINAVKIFNDKEVDELIFLDITATDDGRKPSFELLSKIASEAFMPFSYGGGLRDIEDIKKVLEIGIEKVIINTYSYENPEFIREASEKFGSQSIVAAIDVKKEDGKYEVFKNSGKNRVKGELIEHAVKMAKMGAGEIFLNSINKDGTMEGYDLELIEKVSRVVDIPVIASGGAGRLEDFKKAVKAGASAVSAGSLFVYYGKTRSVLMNYPEAKELENILI